ncbi:enoyl-CoA hydratase/isomerase family protein [Streptomyces durbertensis]|uniref:Enoyl-CoA hydratase/isomerase family protein n=1 Tax=Streptomyces durbertensis TaxID=2448886 RepID=A0ABR6ED01_9ACTN|nr:polyketide synthase [Streptomyces durbertensis]MBB1242384.1 enoyl-CoA hydratase/isomerase family protein [Streptomyces durbertensis]
MTPTHSGTARGAASARARDRVEADAQVVELSWRGPVAVLRMADRQGRNTFGPALCRGLVDAVGRAVADSRSRALLVTGMPELFCAGGSQQELVNFARGDGSFDTDDFFRVFLRCPLPVVAGVQGHAIGGGLVLALYADAVVLSERSVYAANFMRYGFTPGMGATHLLPHRFGPQLGGEMLYTARNYRGAELRERGVPVPVTAHDKVAERAYQLALSMTDAPRASVELLKRELAKPLLDATDEAIAREAAMHRTSFRLPEVMDRIVSAYGDPGRPGG